MFHISPVMKGLLDTIRIDPSCLHDEVRERVERHKKQMCETDVIPRMLGKAAGAAVTNIRRKNRYVLLKLSGRGLFYRERSAKECYVIVPGTLPHTIREKLRGRRLGDVVDLGAIDATLGSCLISDPKDAAFDGAMEFALEPQWLRFES